MFDHKHVELCAILFVFVQITFWGHFQQHWTAAFLVKLPDDLAKLALLLHVGYTRPNCTIPLTRKIQNVSKFLENCLTKHIEKISCWTNQP